MRKGIKQTLTMLLILAMVFTYTAMPVYADDAAIDDQETAAEEVLETETEAAEVIEAEEPASEAIEVIEEETQPEEAAAEEAVAEEVTEPQETAVEAPADVPEVPAANKSAGAALKAASPMAETEEAEDSELDKVRKAIQALDVDPTSYTAADRERIEALNAQFNALSAEDQAVLDAEVSHPDTGQPLGRVLESAVWAVWSYDAKDTSTTLDNGTYDASSTPALSSSYSKGKSTSSRQKPWSVKSVKVVDGVSTATIKVESGSYSDIWMGGKTYPKANSSDSVSVFTGVPIELNSTFYFAGVSTSMPTPIAYSLTTSIDESGEVSDAADYTAVDAAIAEAEKIDRSLYTEESLKALDDAIAAVDHTKTAEEQDAVDAMAKAIEDAIAALEEKEDEPDEGEKIQLTITNKTGMFKAVTAYLIKEDGKEYLVVALSGATYRELHKGTYESAVENGDGSKDNGNDSWIHGYENAAGKVEFRIPVDEGESFVPCVAVSGTYYKNYLEGKNPIGRSFYPRQFTIDRKEKTLVVDDYNEAADFTVTSNVTDFKVADKASTLVIGGPNSNNYSVSPTLVMQDGTYDQVKYPTVKDGDIVDDTVSLSDGKFAISMTNAPGKEAFKDKEAIEMKFHVASDAPYKAAGQWVKRTVTIDKMAKTIVIDGTPLAEKDSEQQDDIVDPDKPIKPDEKQDDSGSGGDSGYAPAVDSSTTLKDGTYTPDSFSWSGGTGKLTISCSEIIVKNGQAYAVIVFSSSKVDQLKASGGLYYKQGGGQSTFTIPVNLNANNTIVARTTAMSSPHWIEYTIYIGLSEGSGNSEKAKEAKKEAAEAKMKISDEAPTIIGLETAEDSEEKIEYAKYFKIFNYEHGVKMLSIDISEKTALKKMYTENAQKAIEAGESEEEVEYDDEGKIITKSRGEYIEALYQNNVVNYLLVPEDFEVPAGLDKEYIIVNIPVDKSFVASDEALALMETLGCADALTLLGIDEKDIKSKDIKKAIEDEKVKTAGDLEKPDFAKVVKAKPGLAILPGDLLPEEIDKDASASEKQKLGEEAMKMKEKLEKLESRFTALSVPVVIDRSAQEEEELAQAEWIKVYGALFGCDDEAKKIFDKKVKEAKKNGKN